MRRDLWKWALLAVWLVVPLEVASCAGGRILARRGVVYRPPPAEGYAEDRAQRDPLLGWPRRDALGGPRLDAHGARRVEDEAPDEAPCGAAFGDSFTYGDEVEARDAWPAQLGRRLGCRVANYGMSGYGTDQALLRFEERFDEPAGFVVLGHFSEDVVRNVNRFRGFLNGAPFGFKPRFRLDATGRLELVPMPEPAEEALPRFGLDGPPLADDWFAPGAPGGTVALRFPYLLSMARLLSYYRVEAWLHGVSSWAPFYSAEHPSGALPLTAAILQAFVERARADGRVGLVLVIPDQQDLRAAQAHGALPYAPLLEALDARGVPRPRLSEAMLAELDGRDPCVFFLRCDGGHISPDAHALIARVVARWLAEHGLAPQPRGQGGPA